MEVTEPHQCDGWYASRSPFRNKGVIALAAESPGHRPPLRTALAKGRCLPQVFAHYQKDSSHPLSTNIHWSIQGHKGRPPHINLGKPWRAIPSVELPAGWTEIPPRLNTTQPLPLAKPASCLPSPWVLIPRAFPNKPQHSRPAHQETQMVKVSAEALFGTRKFITLLFQFLYIWKFL